MHGCDLAIRRNRSASPRPGRPVRPRPRMGRDLVEEEYLVEEPGVDLRRGGSLRVAPPRIAAGPGRDALCANRCGPSARVSSGWCCRPSGTVPCLYRSKPQSLRRALRRTGHAMACRRPSSTWWGKRRVGGTSRKWKRGTFTTTSSVGSNEAGVDFFPMSLISSSVAGTTERRSWRSGSP